MDKKPLLILLNIILLLIMLWLSGFALFFAATTTKKTARTNTDAIIVLTGGPGRIEKGLELFANGLSKNLFITGVHKDATRSEILSKSNNRETLPPCCIILGRKATTTTENAAETKEWIDQNNIKAITMVTSTYHLPRAKLEFSHLMPSLTIITHPVDEYLDHQSKITLLFSEYHKTIYRWIQITLHLTPGETP